MFSVSGAARIRFLLAVVSLTLLLTATGCLDVKIGDKTYPKDTEYLTVTDNNIEDYAVFNRFDKLKTLDLTSIDISPAEFDSISSKVKDSVQILWNVPLGNRKFPNFTRSLDISPELNLTDAAALRYFVNLNAVTVTSIPPSELLAKICGTVREVNPQAVINCSTSVYGVEVDSETELLDLNALPIDDLTELDYLLTALPNIKTAEICSCVLDHEVIAALRDKHPDCKVVWTIRFNKYVVRTDAQVFSILGKMKYMDLTSEALSPLFRYCTDMRALDLGHCNISDLSEMTHMKHLHTLILADNSVKDVSPLAQLPELNYIEIQYNKIKDATPFGELANLEDLYIVENHGLKNISVVTNCKKLKKLDYCACGIGGSEYYNIKKVLPDCNINRTYLGGGNLRYWRAFNEKNKKIREAFAHWKTVKEFPDWQNEVLWERDVYDFSGQKAE